MAKKKLVREIEPEEVSQELPQEEPARIIDEDDEPEANGQSGHSKTDLIREAVQAGYDKPALGVVYIKNKYGVEIDSKYYSIVKGKLGKSTPKEDDAEPKPTLARASGRNEQVPASAGTIPASLFDDLKQLRDLKDFVYCPEAWRLARTGHKSANRAVQEAGTAHHAAKATADRVAGDSITIGQLLITLASLALAAWWFLR